MKYSLKLIDLIDRPILSTAYAEEFLNKMTNEEISLWEKETELILIEGGVKPTFPEWNVAYLSKTIDCDILYKCLKLGDL